MEASDKANHNHAEKEGNANGRKRVSIEHFKQLNIGGNDGDQITHILAIQLRRTINAAGNQKTLSRINAKSLNAMNGYRIALHTLEIANQCKNQNPSE
jgi:hypothetical protein